VRVLTLDRTVITADHPRGPTLKTLSSLTGEGSASNRVRVTGISRAWLR
jgi:hypothetical protein